MKSCAGNGCVLSRYGFLLMAFALLGVGGCLSIPIPSGTELVDTKRVSSDLKSSTKTLGLLLDAEVQGSSLIVNASMNAEATEWDEVVVEEAFRRRYLVVGLFPCVMKYYLEGRRGKSVDAVLIGIFPGVLGVWLTTPLGLCHETFCRWSDWGDRAVFNRAESGLYWVGFAKAGLAEEFPLKKLDESQERETQAIKNDPSLYAARRDRLLRESQARHAREREEVKQSFRRRDTQIQNRRVRTDKIHLRDQKVKIRVASVAFETTAKTDYSGDCRLDLANLPFINSPDLKAEIVVEKDGHRASTEVILPGSKLGLNLAKEIMDGSCRWDTIYLSGKRVDFSNGNPRLAPQPRVTTEFLPQVDKKPGDVRMAVTVTNTGRGPLYRLAAVVDSDAVSSADGKLLVFGKVEPGDKATRVVSVSLRGLEASGSYPLRLRFREANGYHPTGQMAVLSGGSLMWPSLAWTYEIVDDKKRSETAVGNADGVIQKGEAIDLVVTVKNNGKAKAAGAKVKLDVPSDPSVSVLSQTEQALGEIAPGAVKSVRFNIAVKQWSSFKKIEPKISVSEASFEQLSKRAIELPFDVRVARRPVVVDRDYYVRADEAVLRSGASQDAAEYARAPKGSALHAIGELYGTGQQPEWVHVELAVKENGKSRTEELWVDWRSLSPKPLAGAGGTAQPIVVTRFSDIPPTVTFVSPSSDTETVNDAATLTINVTEALGKLTKLTLLAGPDEARLDDVTKAAKVEGIGANRIIRYSPSLAIGPNIFKVIATNDKGKTAERTLVITRKAGFDKASYALSIGIDEYLFEGKVPGCRGDAKAVAEAVRRVRRLSPENLFVMTDDATKEVDKPNKTTLETRIEDFADELGEGGLAFFYFSGHGVTRDGDLYLIPQNSRRGKGIRLSFVMKKLDASKARQKVIVIDACRAAAEKGVSGIVPNLKVSKDTAVFLSCGKDEKSYPGEDGKRSVYTKFFVQALREAAVHGAKPVTAQSLHERISELMAKWRKASGKKQTPQLIVQGGATVNLTPARRK